MIKKLYLRQNVHIQELMHGAAVAFLLKVIAAGMAFALNVVLARLLGAEGSGIFFLTLTIVIIVSAVGRIGMENALVRFVASNVAAGHIAKVLGVYKKAMRYTFLVASSLALLLFMMTPWLSQIVFNKPELEKPLSLMSSSVVFLALLTLHAHALQGLKKIAASISVLSLIVPLLTCIVAMIFVPLYGIDAAAWGYISGTIVTLLFGRLFWVRATHGLDRKSAEFETIELLKSSMPLYAVVIMNMVIMWSPLLFLGVWDSSENVGIYSAASRTAMLTSFVLIAVNTIAAPKFAALYEKRDLVSLEMVARNSAKIMVLLAAPALLLFLLVPELILSVFGAEFKQGAYILMILAVGQFINVATGSVGYLLMMSGNEQLMRNNLVFCAILGILLNVILIPAYGVIGAAVGAAIVLSVQNLIAMAMVWRKLHIVTLPWIMELRRRVT
jgi:O-antigen/teichoic acid export membrane protein